MPTIHRGKGVGKRVAQGLRSRDKLLRVAAQRFAKHGFSATSVDDVCQETGVVKSALYWHFENKEGLLNAVLENAAHAFEETAQAWIDDIVRDVASAGDARARLKRAVIGMREVIEGKAAMLRLMHGILLDGTGFNRKTRAILLRVYQRVREALVAGIAEAIGASPPGLEAIASLILAVLNGAFIADQLLGDSKELDRIFAELEQAILALVGSRMASADTP